MRHGGFNYACCMMQRLGRAAASGCELAYVVEEDGALQSVELRRVSGDLSEERVGHQNRCLVAVPRGGVAEQGGDIHLQRLSQSVERGEGWHSLAILDLRDVSARHVHACRELPLRKIAYMAKITNCRGDLKAVMGGCGRGDDGQRYRCRFWFLDLERFVAAAAHRVDCAELHQTAVVAAQDLTLFDGCHHGCHKLS